jgi:hypothetical protein
MFENNSTAIFTRLGCLVFHDKFHSVLKNLRLTVLKKRGGGRSAVVSIPGVSHDLLLDIFDETLLDLITAIFIIRSVLLATSCLALSVAIICRSSYE